MNTDMRFTSAHSVEKTVPVYLHEGGARLSDAVLIASALTGD